MSGFGYNVLGFGANASSAAAGGASDDQFNRVSFLSHFDGANNGVNNAFDDGSASNHTITANGSAAQGSFGPFARPDGEWGVSFDGGSYVTSNYLQVAESSDFDFGTGDFTVEFFFFNRAYGAYYDYLVTFGNSTTTTSSFGIYLEGGTNINLWQNSAAIASSTSYNTNQWYHLAVVRASGTVKVYLDGSEIKSASFSSDISSPGGMNVANWRLASDSQYFNGIISNLRVVKGTAVYTGNFTAPTSKLTAITNTVLLTCQSNRFVDNSATGHTVTPYVSPAVTAFGPFLTSSVYKAGTNGGSAYFDGDGDYLTVASSSDFDFGTSDFCWECWVFQTSRSAFQLIMAQDDYSSGNSISCWLTNTGQASIYYEGGGTHFTTTTTVPLNTWTHLAWVRKGTGTNEFSIYINGTAEVSGTMTTSFDQDGIIIGQQANGSYDFNGYVSNIRILKGTAVYTGNFTPPTAPLTAITNTKLLLNMADGQAIDSAAQSNMSLHGDANTSTDQAKFGTASLHLDGSGDFSAGSDTSVGHFGGGNFTAECWIYPTASPNQPIIMGQWNGSYSWAIQMSNDSSRNLRFLTSSVGDQVSSTAVALNQWSHVALVRNGNTFDIYLNGTSVKTATNSAALLASTDAFTIGNNAGGGQPFQGYIDEVRISKMARYTSNFTAPSESFPDKGQ